jgi:membrane fusion protein, multidrug efflux system
MKSKIIITLAAIAAIIFLSVLFSGWLGEKKPQPEVEQPERTLRLVETMPVKYQNVTAAIEVPGRLASGKIVDIISEVQGEILVGDINLKKGESFSKGQMLCKIYDTERILTIQAAKSRFLNALAGALADVKFDFPESYQAMITFFDKIDLYSHLPEFPEIEDRSLRIFLAGRDILNQYYTIKGMEERLDRHYIKAPFNGSIISVNLEAGGIANMGTRIAQIIETDLMELEVPVKVSDLKWVKMGDHVSILDEQRTSAWQGKITRISDFIDPETQSAIVFVEIENDSEKPILPGMFLIALFENKILSNTMEIPRQAVFNQNEVFVVIDSALQKQSISIQKINNETVIFNGIEEGAIIVTEPLINVKEGTLVATRKS